MFISFLGATKCKISTANLTHKCSDTGHYIFVPQTVSLVIKNANTALKIQLDYFYVNVDNFPNRIYSLNVWFHKVESGSLLYSHDNIFI